MLARLLGATQYGIFAGAFAVSLLVGRYSSLGSGVLLLRYVSADREKFAEYWGNILISVFCAGGILSAGLCWLAPRLLNASSASLVIFAAASNCLFGALTEQTACAFQCFEKMRVTAALNLLTNLMRTLAVVAMLWGLHQATAWQWAAASTLVSAIAAAIAVGMVIRSFGLPRFAVGLFLKRGMEGFGYSFATSAASIYNDLDKTLLSHYGMNAANGIYSTAYRIIDLASIHLDAIRQAVIPRLFKHGRAGIADGSALSYRLLKRSLPFTFLMAVILFLAAPLIPRIIGSGFAESVAAVRWLCLIPVFRSVHIACGDVLTGAGMQSYRTIGQLAVAVLNLSLNLWAIPHFGWLGAAWVSLISDGTLALLTWGILHGIGLKKSYSKR
jgi:O-antigen/teichoic acid export membrane protein